VKTSIRFNEEELKRHQEIKEYLGLDGTFGEDSATIKIAEEIAHNVLHNFFGSDLKKIFLRAKKQSVFIKKAGRPKNPTIVAHPLSDLSDKDWQEAGFEPSSERESKNDL